MDDSNLTANTSLRIIAGAINERHLIDALRHVRIYPLNETTGRIQSSNGVITVDAPFPHPELDITVPASKFISAVNLQPEAAMTVTAKGRLHVHKSKFKVFLPLLDNAAFPKMQPDGELYAIGEGLLETLGVLRPFTGDMKDWMRGIMLRNGYAYATNAFVALRAKVDVPPEVCANVPAEAISELLRIKMDITALRVSESSVTFRLGESSWLRTSTLGTDWPDVDAMLTPGLKSPVPEGLHDAINAAMPFCDDRIPLVDLGAEGVSAVGDSDHNDATLVLPDARFHARMLSDVLDFAANIDFTQYPRACPFNDGAAIDGVIVGVARSVR